jgi:flagellar hook-length control protein FliK
MRALGVALGFGCFLSAAGCDYWPPALQAQIEQLRSETETLNMEKSQLQSQVNDLSKTRQDLQLHVDELSRVNREKTEIIASLQRRLDASHSKGGKILAPSKAPAKSMAKQSAKPPVKKKATVKR